MRFGKGGKRLKSKFCGLKLRIERRSGDGFEKDKKSFPFFFWCRSLMMIDGSGDLGRLNGCFLEIDFIP